MFQIACVEERDTLASLSLVGPGIRSLAPEKLSGTGMAVFRQWRREFQAPTSRYGCFCPAAGNIARVCVAKRRRRLEKAAYNLMKAQD